MTSEPAKPTRRNVVVRRAAPAATPVAAAPAARVREANEFLPALLDIVEVPRSPLRFFALAALLGMFATALLWSYFGHIAVYAEAPGRIQAVGRTKIVEPREAGQVIAIRARNGDRVKAGDILVELDPTEALADRQIVADKIVSLRAETLRRRAEIAAARADKVDPAAAIVWDADIPHKMREREEMVLRGDLASLAATLAELAAQRHEKDSETKKFTAAVAAENELIKVISEHVGMHEQLESQGWNSRATVLSALAKLKEAQITLTELQGKLADAAAAIPVIDTKIVRTREDFVTADTQQLAVADRQLEDLAQQLVKASQVVSDMTLQAPLAGIVEASAVTTIGQVVKPTQQLMQVVPVGGPLEIQAYVGNSDIGFIRKGQPADIKVTTFPYQIYGMLPGKVVQIATDALPATPKNTLQPAALDGMVSETSAAQKTGSIVFPITVLALRSTMPVDGKEIPLSSGMAVTVDLETERRRAIDYIVSPLINLFTTAAHER